MALLLGDIVPDFDGHSTQGDISFHAWREGQWCVFFSHPKDFTPVCTTELGMVQRLMPQFQSRNAKVIAISVDSVEDHHRWIKDIEETQNVTLTYPLLGDPDRKIAHLYGMIHPNAAETVTVRSVFIIDGAGKLRTSITYPPSTGRNFKEILRALDSLQLTDSHKVATPADWNDGDDVIVLPSLSDADATPLFPKGWKTLKPYLRVTPQPNK